LPVGVIFANELLDALPAHRVRWRGGRLRELCVGLDAAGQFAWVECEPTTPRLGAHFARLGVELEEGQAAEVNLAAEEWLARAASAFARGYVVLVDYGAEASQLYNPTLRPEGTLRAFQRHQLSADALARPGEQDLTTTVNWTQMRRAAEDAGLRLAAYARQDEFLLRAGLLDQLERMSARLATEAERVALRVSTRDLILPGGMGESFQVLVWEK
jgi:SAM-dependent MidA family methyltransferase